MPSRLSPTDSGLFLPAGFWRKKTDDDQSVADDMPGSRAFAAITGQNFTARFWRFQAEIASVAPALTCPLQ
ncbi:hypothetical protein HA42_21985 [Pantoea deleyi]|nr:hypothetical protein HA42_21985 [Pantoea deleyi]